MGPGWAAAYVGIPYQANGRDRTGLDCYGLVRLVLQEMFGVEPPRYDGQNGPGRAEAFQEAVAASNAWQPVETPEPGDVVLLTHSRLPIHCGLIVAPGVMLHACEGISSCVERTDGVKWANRIQGYYRFSDRSA